MLILILNILLLTSLKLLILMINMTKFFHRVSSLLGSFSLTNFFIKLLNYDYYLGGCLLFLVCFVFPHIYPHKLIFTALTVSKIQICVYGVLSSLFTISLVYLVWSKYYNAGNKDSIWLKEWTNYKYKRWNFLINTFMLKFHIPDFTPVLLDKLVLKLYTDSYIYHQLIFFLLGLPRMIIAVIFVVDIFYFQEFYYFYLSLFLLLFLVFYDILCYLLLQYYEINIDNFREILDITEPIEINGNVRNFYHYKDPDYHALMPLDQYLETQYLPLECIPNYLDVLRLLRSYKLFWINLVVYPVFAIGWGYLFYMALMAI